MFFDDLQWLDAATLDFVEDLLTAADLKHLLLIGAYRDNEVTSAHPVMAMLARLRKAAVPLCEVVLAPLSRTHVGQLIGDALRSPRERLHELADLVAERTGGNPFFVIQFLTSLEADGRVRFAAQRYSIAMRAELAADLPTVEADRVQLQQVLMNLLLNGIESMKDRPGGELTVTSRRGPGGELLPDRRRKALGRAPERSSR